MYVLDVLAHNSLYKGVAFRKTKKKLNPTV